jgi:hypothetical protein
LDPTDCAACSAGSRRFCCISRAVPPACCLMSPERSIALCFACAARCRSRWLGGMLPGSVAAVRGATHHLVSYLGEPAANPLHPCGCHASWIDLVGQRIDVATQLGPGPFGLFADHVGIVGRNDSVQPRFSGLGLRSVSAGRSAPYGVRDESGASDDEPGRREPRRSRPRVRRRSGRPSPGP